MEKRRVHISECMDDDVLAEDIINLNGMLVLSANTVFNQYIIQRLADYGIDYVWVSSIQKEDLPYKNYHIFEKKYEKSIKEMKQLILDLIKGKKVDYAVIGNITKTILSAWEEPEHVIRCLGSIRDSDDYTYYHCVNVSFYSMLIAGWLNLAKDDVKTVIQAGLLHDIGKVKVPGKLLNKEGKLSGREFEEIKRHAIYGYELVKGTAELSEEVKDAILMHHEREDKSGYPLKAGGDDLSIYTKIIAVADVFDAMTSNRPYRKALTPFSAFDEFLTICAMRLDINIIKALIHNLSRYYMGSSVLLSNGQTANIAYVPPHCVCKPIVDTGSGFLDLSREKELSIVGMI